MKNTYRLFTFFLMVLPSFVFGQSIKGQVLNDKNLPEDFASVSLLIGKDSTLVKTTVTDKNGEYKFNTNQNGSYLIMATSVGYKKAYSAVLSINEQNSTIEVTSIVLSKESRAIKEVAITAQKPFIERRADKLIVNVESSASAAGNTALEVLQKSPGIAVDKDDNISMNGKNSVLIMIDGKPTYMSSADVANMLRSMQSSEIETIELITNPSAKYDAAGNAGIINIKTKRNKSLGFNGTLSAGTGYGETSKYNSGLSMNFRKGKMNVFGNYNYSNNGNISRFWLNRVVAESADLTRFAQSNSWDGRRSNNSYKIGADWFVNKKTTFGILMNGYNNGVTETALSGTEITNTTFSPIGSLMVDGNNKQRYVNTAFNFNAKSTLDTNGRELTFDGDYSFYDGKLDEYRDNSFQMNPAKETRYTHNLAPADINIISTKADYTHPISKSLKIETGLKASFVKTDNNFQFDTLRNQNWISDSGRSNHFIYSENINAAYININKQHKGTTVQIGLRAEQTNSKGNSVTRDSIFKKEYLNFFPSASISQKLGKDHQLGLTFSRRIDRPSYDNLNPFIYILDEYTYQQGNPNLNPQFTNSTDLSYTLKSKYTLTLNYSRTNQVIAGITEQDNKTKITYAQDRNLEHQTIYSANLYTPFTLFSWWKLNNNMQVFNMAFKSELQGEMLDVNQTVFQTNTDNQFTINKATSAELSFWYMSPLTYGIFKIRNTPGFNIGFKRALLKDKMNVRLSVNDIFNTRTNKGRTDFGNMNLNFHNKWESRVANLSLTYRFGNKNVTAERNRKTSLESESNRMKN